MKVKVGAPRSCERNGHIIALRTAWLGTEMSLVPFCESCRLVFGAGVVIAGPQAAMLQSHCNQARTAPAATR